eukprot:219493-Amphidinium_carterae.1
MECSVITPKDVSKALKAFTQGKATEADGVQMDYLRALPPHLHKVWAAFFNWCKFQGALPLKLVNSM